MGNSSVYILPTHENWQSCTFRAAPHTTNTNNKCNSFLFIFFFSFLFFDVLSHRNNCLQARTIFNAYNYIRVSVVFVVVDVCCKISCNLKLEFRWTASAIDFPFGSIQFFFHNFIILCVPVLFCIRFPIRFLPIHICIADSVCCVYDVEFTMNRCRYSNCSKRVESLSHHFLCQHSALEHCQTSLIDQENIMPRIKYVKSRRSHEYFFVFALI